MNESVLKQEERAVMSLRELYRAYGYRLFKMSKFEEYDLYARNKEFLVSDRVITFTDTTGKLMALKPDVTLSIVKNVPERGAGVRRVYYNENVYRVSDKTHQYKEIEQTGLECLGALTEYHVLEVLSLAAKSLDRIAEGSLLSVSHLGVVEALLSSVTGGVRRELLACLREKNPHGMREACDRAHLDPSLRSMLIALTGAYGDVDEVVARLSGMTDDEDVHASLAALSRAAQACRGTGCRVVADFSLVGDMGYYNGIIFRGYVRGLPSAVLSGGQYDRLMEKMGKDARAVGFAVYLDLLTQLGREETCDVDVLLLHREQDDPLAVLARVEELTARGERVSTGLCDDGTLRYGRIEHMGEGDAK